MTTTEEEKEPAKPICFILARKGSKRLPRKAMLKINKKPLIHYPIKAAKDSGVFGAVVVSSDDMELLEYAYERKTLLHKRPRELCTSRVQQKQVMRFLLSLYRCDLFCIMTPCNPFVTPEDLKAGFELLKESNYVISASEGKPVEYALKEKKRFIEPRILKRSQEYKPTYYADGGFVFSKVEAFAHEFDYGFYGSGCALYKTPHISVDIDTEEDYKYAKWILEKKQS